MNRKLKLSRRMPKLRGYVAVEVDGGLWEVWTDQHGEAGGERSIGFVHDRGCCYSDAPPEGYDALVTWDSCVPGKLVGTGRDLSSGIRKLIAWDKGGRKGEADLPYPDYHPDVMRAAGVGKSISAREPSGKMGVLTIRRETYPVPSEVMEAHNEMKAFLWKLCRDHRDAIWQDDWIELRIDAGRVLDGISGA